MKKIFPLELKKLMDSDKNEFQLVDIRDEYEYDICCIGGEKINMYSIIDNLDKLSKEKKVIIYCRTWPILISISSKLNTIPITLNKITGSDIITIVI